MFSGQTKEKGFTVLSLMVSMAILSILVGFASMTFPKFKKSARQSEAINGLGAISRMILAHQALATDLSATSGGWQSCNADGCLLNHYNPKLCNAKNPIGFQAPCSGKYYFRLQFQPGNPGRYLIRAHEKRDTSICEPGAKNKPRDKFYFNWCGKLCNYETYSNDCKSIEYSDCGDPWSC